MKKYHVFIILAFLFSMPTQANEGAYVKLHLASHHIGAQEFNESNYGIGIKLVDDSGTMATAGALRNSINTTTAYFGIGKEFQANPVVGFGFAVGMIVYPSAGQNITSSIEIYPVLLPSIIISKEKWQAEITYIPGFLDEVQQALLFTLNRKIN